MLERFGDEARRVVSLAQDEARLLAHTATTSEHLVLALLHSSRRGVAVGTLRSLGVTLDGARSMVEQRSGRGSMVLSGRLPFTASCRKALEAGLEEALQFGGGPVGPEHILLALLRQPESGGTQLLVMLGAPPAEVRDELLRRIGAPTVHGPPDAADGPGAGDLDEGRGWAAEAGRVLPPLLTSSAREVIGAGRLEARRMGHAHLGTEHLLLALANGVDEATTTLLLECGVTPDRVRASLSPPAREVLLGLAGDLPLTPRAKQVVSRSLDRARAHGERAVGARHLLVSLLVDGGGAVGLILSDLDAPVTRLRRDAEALCRRPGVIGG